MHHDVTVRPARAEDCPSIQSIATETWQATYHGSIPDRDIREFLQSNYNIEHLERVVERMAGGLLLATVRGEPTGYAMVSVDQDGNAQLWAIYVLPDRQQSGVGKALWDAVADHARTLGPANLVLWVLESNLQARAFYERQGAVQTAQRDFPVGSTSISEIQYTLSLG